MAERITRTPFPAQVPRATRGKAGRTSTQLTPVNIRASGLTLDDKTRAHVKRRLGRQLGKFVAHVERVSVRLSDTNGPRGGVDHACDIKVVLSGRPSVVVEERARTARAAFDSAAARTERAVRRSLGRSRMSAGKGTLATVTKEALPRGGASQPKAQRKSTARRNYKERTGGFTAALEDSEQDRPSRKSTRGSANRAKRDTQLRQRELRRKRAPKTRARRSATKQPVSLER